MRGLNTELDFILFREKLLSKEICTTFVGFNNQLVDVLIKSLRKYRIEFICSKIGTYNLFALAWVSVRIGIKYRSLVVVSKNCYMLYL